jgi:hypothetical protein
MHDFAKDSKGWIDVSAKKVRHFRVESGQRVWLSAAGHL